ncbi:MAG TPA: phosphatase PAP2 family protein [Gemmatimonadales bacterium]|nr:phosphatase PAP2 family protein [Gemmatimonadales bacterium]
MPPFLFALLVPVVLFVTFWALCYWPLAGVVSVMKVGLKRGSAWLVQSRWGKWAFGHAGPLGPYAPILLVMALGGIAAVGAGYVFVVLAEQFRLTTSVVYQADQAVHTWFGHERQPAMTVLLSTVTWFGGMVGEAVSVAVVAVLLLVRKQRASAIFLMVTAATGGLLNTALKMIFARARPDMASALAVARWYSYPSGHAMASFITFGALAYLALRLPWPWLSKSAALAIALTMVVLVGVSRVYLGVHWASDIAGGWSAGTVWLVTAVVSYEMLLRLRQRRRGAAPTSPAADIPDKPVPAHPVTS